MSESIETVTIPLHKFRQMEEEIKSLRRDNIQKTIYKEIMPPIYGQVLFVLFIIILTCLIKFT